MEVGWIFDIEYRLYPIFDMLYYNGLIYMQLQEKKNLEKKKI